MRIVCCECNKEYQANFFTVEGITVPIIECPFCGFQHTIEFIPILKPNGKKKKKIKKIQLGGGPYYAALGGTRILSIDAVTDHSGEDDGDIWKQKAEFIIAVCIHSDGKDTVSSAYKLQWQDNDDGGGYVDLASDSGSPELSYTIDDTSWNNGDTIATGDQKCDIQGGDTRQAGERIKNASLSDAIDLPDAYQSELWFGIDTTNSDIDHTYSFQLYSIAEGAAIGICGATLKIADYPDVLNDGNTVGWYIFDEMTTITKDGADLVSDWEDYLGSGHDIEQAGPANQPLWTANGIVFDGSEHMAGAFTLVQPTHIYIVIKQVTWTNWDYIFDGDTQDGGAVMQNATTPGLKAFAGSFSAQDDNLALDTWGIIRALFDGASSELIVDDNTPVTGNWGSGDMDGFTLGGAGNGGAESDIIVKEVILRKIADSSGDETDIYNYLKDKYGFGAVTAPVSLQTINASQLTPIAKANMVMPVSLQTINISQFGITVGLSVTVNLQIINISQFSPSLKIEIPVNLQIINISQLSPKILISVPVSLQIVNISQFAPDIQVSIPVDLQTINISQFAAQGVISGAGITAEVNLQTVNVSQLLPAGKIIHIVEVNLLTVNITQLFPTLKISVPVSLQQINISQFAPEIQVSILVSLQTINLSQFTAQGIISGGIITADVSLQTINLSLNSVTALVIKIMEIVTETSLITTEITKDSSITDEINEQSTITNEINKDSII